MRLFKKVPMTFEQKAYEIRVYYTDAMINIVSFLDNHPADVLRHQIQVPKKCNVQGILQDALLDELIEMSRKDIVEKRGERILKIIRANMTIEKSLDL